MALVRLALFACVRKNEVHIETAVVKLAQISPRPNAIHLFRIQSIGSGFWWTQNLACPYAFRHSISLECSVFWHWLGELGHVETLECLPVIANNTHTAYRLESHY